MLESVSLLADSCDLLGTVGAALNQGKTLCARLNLLPQ